MILLWCVCVLFDGCNYLKKKKAVPALTQTCYTGLEQHESNKSRQNYNFGGN